MTDRRAIATAATQAVVIATAITALLAAPWAQPLEAMESAYTIPSALANTFHVWGNPALNRMQQAAVHQDDQPSQSVGGMPVGMGMEPMMGKGKHRCGHSRSRDLHVPCFTFLTSFSVAFAALLWFSVPTPPSPVGTAPAADPDPATVGTELQFVALAGSYMMATGSTVSKADAVATSAPSTPDRPPAMVPGVNKSSDLANDEILRDSLSCNFYSSPGRNIQGQYPAVICGVQRPPQPPPLRQTAHMPDGPSPAAPSSPMEV